MKILFLSDFHNSMTVNNLERILLESPTPDVVITMGDISVGDLTMIRKIFSMVPVYGICGNHDEGAMLELTGINDIHGKCVYVQNVRFAGFGGSARYKGGPYMMYTQKESLDIAKDIPAADIFVTHDRAYKGRKRDITDSYSQSTHEGLAGISKYIKVNKPWLHVHGHIHKNKRYMCNGVDTVSVFGIVYIELENKAVKDYRVIFEP